MSQLRCLLTLAACAALLAGGAAVSLAGDLFSSPTATDIPKLIEHLSDPSLRGGASRALVSLKGEPVAALVDSLKSDSLPARIWAAFTLGRIGRDAAPAAGPLAGVLQSAEDPQERSVAARSLGRIATAENADRQAAVRALRTGLADSDVRVRRHSVESLGQLGPIAAAASSDLVSLLSDDTVRETTLRSLVQVGPAAAPDLVAALKDDDVRLEAASALKQIDPSAAREAGVGGVTAKDLPALRIALHSESRSTELRVAAARQLGDLGVDAAPILIDVFSTKDEVVARQAVAAFQHVGPAAIARLKREAEADSAVVRARSLDAIGAIGPPARDAVPILVAALADSDRIVQHRAVAAIDALGESAAPAVPDLIGVMQNPRILEQTRQLALKVLVRETTDSHRGSVIQALEESTKDGNFGISSLARESLKTLKADAKSSSP